jgi:hypothetical protein
LSNFPADERTAEKIHIVYSEKSHMDKRWKVKISAQHAARGDEPTKAGARVLNFTNEAYKLCILNK